MAITNNNVENVKFLRNGVVFVPSNDKTARQVALDAMEGQKSNLADGTAILGRYQETNGIVKTLVGFAYISGETKTLTVFDVDGAGADVDEKIKTAIEALDTEITSVDGKNVQVKVTEADGKITAVNITTDNTVNSGDVDTAIINAINELDGSVIAETGYFVKSVTEVDGKISGTTEALPTVAAISEAGKPITAVSESLGSISATAGTINAEYVNIADSDDKFSATTVEGALAEIAAEIDAMDKTASSADGEVVITVVETDGKVTEEKSKLKDVLLTGYAKTNDTGDIAATDSVNVALSKLENKAAAITIANDDKSINVTTSTTGTNINVNIKDGEHVLAKDGNAGIYTNIALSSITPSSTIVKEEYQLTATDGKKLGDTIKIYKDSSISKIYLGYSTDTVDENTGVITSGTTGEPQSLNYVYHKEDGKYEMVHVDVSKFLVESEFASGVTADATGVVHGVVDTNSEKDTQATPVDFLTVGENGFKVSGIKDEIDRKINALDATGGTTTVDTDKHVAVQVIEENGLITAVTVTEDNIADADDLAALSAKTVTEVASSNDSITAALSAATDGTKHLDIITDASKIKMSGFTSTDVLSGINSTSSVTQAFKEVDKVITDNEQVVSTALNDLEETKVENIVVNGVTGTFNDKVASVTIDGADIKLDGYTKPSSSGAVAPTDTVNQAIGKLEKGIEQAIASGLQQVNSGSGITVSAVADNQQTINVKLADANNITGVAENAIKFNSTDSGLYIDYLDCGIY